MGNILACYADEYQTLGQIGYSGSEAAQHLRDRHLEAHMEQEYEEIECLPEDRMPLLEDSRGVQTRNVAPHPNAEQARGGIPFQTISEGGETHILPVLDQVREVGDMQLPNDQTVRRIPAS
mgnify:CR=1 FL=1